MISNLRTLRPSGERIDEFMQEGISALNGVKLLLSFSTSLVLLRALRFEI